MALELVLAPVALRDLKGIASYITVEMGMPQAVERTMGELLETMDQLCEFPDLGRPVSDDRLEGRGYRRIAVKNYWIFYLPAPEANQLRVMRVLHQRQSILAQKYFDVEL